MSKNPKNEQSIDEAVSASHRKANIAVGIVAGITALILIVIAVLCLVRVNPMSNIASPDESKSECYELYDLDSSTSLTNTSTTGSKIRAALGSMDFNIMNALIQWHWDYSFNFERNSSGDLITKTAADIKAVSADADRYMVEFVYTNATKNGELDKSIAKSVNVDGEVIYFDRLKVLIGNTNNNVGEIELYPYVYDRVTNRAANDGLAYETYKITPIKIRANTTAAYKALGEIVEVLKRG